MSSQRKTPPNQAGGYVDENYEVPMTRSKYRRDTARQAEEIRMETNNNKENDNNNKKINKQKKKKKNRYSYS